MNIVYEVHCYNMNHKINKGLWHFDSMHNNKELFNKLDLSPPYESL